MTEKDQEIFGMSSHNCRSNNSRFSLASSSTKPDDQLPTNCLVDNEDVPLLEEFEVLQNIEHCHSVFLSHSHIKAWKRLLWASILCLFFMLTEVVGGILAGSLAVMTDAAHLLSDFVGFLVSLFAIWVAAQPPTKKFSFGYYRAEVLGALFSITVIWLLTGIFVYLAILRLIKSDYDIHADAMIVVSGFGIFVNLGMGLVLHGGCSELHSHGSNNLDNSHPPININIRASIIHVLGDMIQSVGVFISAWIIKFYPEAKIADPICTFIFSILVLATTFRVFMDSLWVLLETTPSNISYNELITLFKSIDGVKSVHDLHVWTLTPGQNALSVHLCVDNFSDNEDIMTVVQNVLKSKFHLRSTTIQIDKYQPYIIQNCDRCQDLKD